MPPGIWVPFAIGTFEPDHYWDWKVGNVSATGHRVVSQGATWCELSFTVPAWAIGFGVGCRMALSRIGVCRKRVDYFACPGYARISCRLQHISPVEN